MTGRATTRVDAVLVYAADVEALIRRGYETPDVDYKGPGNWQTWTRAEKAELVRDMMAVGNADRPGWIILGISQGSDRQWIYQGLTQTQAGSFDPSDIGKKVKEHADPEVRFSAQQVEADGKLYVAIRVEPFATMPHVCTRSSGDVLEEAAIYVRTEAAETAKVRRAEQMRMLVERAVKIHADSMVQRIADLVQHGQGQSALRPRLGDESRFATQAEEARRRR